MSRPGHGRLHGSTTGLLAGVALAGLEGLLWQWPLLHGTTMRFDPAAPVLAAGAYGLAGALAGWAGPGSAWLALALASGGACLWTGDPADAALRAVAAAAAVALGRGALRSPRVLIGLGALGLTLPLWIPADPPLPGTPDRPDIVLVVLDTVAAKHTSLHGSSTGNTPTLERLAAEGLFFESAVSGSPWTIPAHATLFTGALPRETGCHFERPLLDDVLPTTAEQVTAAGYRAGLFAANPWLEPSTGLARGFGTVHSQSIYAASFWAYGLFRWMPEAPYKGGPIIVREALHWLDRGGDTPSLAVLNLMEAHAPYHLVEDPGRYGVDDPETVGERVFAAQTDGWWVHGFPADAQEQRDAERLFAAAVGAVDAQLEALVDGLQERGRLDDTWIIVTSDHGEAFGEHGVYGHLVGLWSELLHVPLVIRGPGLRPGRVDEVVSLQAIHPTVLSLAGVHADAPALVPWPPPPATGTGLGWPSTGPGVAVSEQFRPELMWSPGLWGPEAEGNRWDQRAVRVRIGPKALVVEQPADGSGPRRHVELLGPLPAEDQPAVRALDERLESAVQAVLAVPDAAIGREDPELEQGLMERLSALGYMDHEG